MKTTKINKYLIFLNDLDKGKPCTKYIVLFFSN